MLVLFILVLLVLTLAIYDYKEFSKMHFAKMKDGFVEGNNRCNEEDYDYFDKKIAWVKLTT